MGKKNTVTELEKMSIEEKLKLLNETDKAYICGYIDRAFLGLLPAENINPKRTPAAKLPVKDKKPQKA